MFSLKFPVKDVLGVIILLTKLELKQILIKRIHFDIKFISFLPFKLKWQSLQIQSEKRPFQKKKKIVSISLLNNCIMICFVLSSRCGIMPYKFQGFFYQSLHKMAHNEIAKLLKIDKRKYVISIIGLSFLFFVYKFSLAFFLKLLIFPFSLFISRIAFDNLTFNESIFTKFRNLLNLVNTQCIPSNLHLKSSINV